MYSSTILRSQNDTHKCTRVQQLEYSSTSTIKVLLPVSEFPRQGVNKATDKLLKVANTPQAILDLGLENLREHIKTIGLYNNKAKNVYAACQILVERHGGEVPENRESLEALPGVGRKTANVVLNTAFRHLTMAVDTHIFRLSNRTGIAKGKDVVQVEKVLMKHVPKDFLLDAHHWLILHGRYICVARKPRCAACNISDLCDFKEKNL